MRPSIEHWIYKRLVGPEVVGQDREHTPQVLERQPRNFLRHVQALALTKTGDGLMDPKLVLACILGSFGAPGLAIGLLVPIREAGALVPQLLMASAVDAAPRKKGLWAAGAVGQGAAVAGMSCVAWYGAGLGFGEDTGSGPGLGRGGAAAWAIVGFLALFALFRALCSVSYRPLQGATLVRGSRGAATGTAGSVGAAAVLGFGGLLAWGAVAITVKTLAAALAVGACLWWLAAWCVLLLCEAPTVSETTGGPEKDGLWPSFRESLGLLKDARFRRFCLVRSLLVPTALAPPFLVTAGEAPRGIGTLGVFVLASSGAAVLSSAPWGRLADRSSRRVLMWSGLIAAAALGLTGWAAHFSPERLAPGWVLPLGMFALMCAYHGVRVGRATHLVDMAPEGKRAAYTAVSNTVIGGVLVLASGFGVLVERGGHGAALLASSALCLVAAGAARTLGEVQSPRGGA